MILENHSFSDSNSLPIANNDNLYLALFDFDGTISKRDSMLAFLWWSHSTPSFLFKSALSTPILIAYGLKFLSNEKAKNLLLKLFFKSWSEARFTKVANLFSLKVLDKLVRKTAKTRLKEHLQAGHEVVVVSASLTSWLKPWCEHNELVLIATNPNFSGEGAFYGIKGKNCCNGEKVTRIKAQYKLENYSLIYAYGDSNGDREMLELADISFYKPFRLKLT